MSKKPDLSDLKSLIEMAKLPLKVPLKKKTSPSSRHEAVHSVEQIRKFIEGERLSESPFIPVSTELIYNRYLNWCRTNYENSTPYLVFFKKFRLFFNPKKIGATTHYLVSPIGFDLSLENQQFVKNEIQKKKVKKSSKT